MAGAAISDVVDEAECEDPQVVAEKRHRALALLKQEDLLWSVEQHTTLFTDARAKNLSLKEEIAALHKTYDDHMQARDKRIEEMESLHAKAVEEIATLNVELNLERSSRRREAAEAERSIQRKQENSDSIIQELTLELNGLQQFHGDREELLTQLDAHKEQLMTQKRESEEKLHHIYKVLEKERQSKDEEVKEAIRTKSRNLREMVEKEFVGDLTKLIEEKNKSQILIDHLSGQVQDLLKSLSASEAKQKSLRRELNMSQEMHLRSRGLIRFYMNLVNKVRKQEAALRSQAAPSCPPSIPPPCSTKLLEEPTSSMRGDAVENNRDAFETWKAAATGLEVCHQARRPSKRSTARNASRKYHVRCVPTTHGDTIFSQVKGITSEATSYSLTSSCLVKARHAQSGGQKIHSKDCK